MGSGHTVLHKLANFVQSTVRVPLSSGPIKRDGDKEAISMSNYWSKLFDLLGALTLFYFKAFRTIMTGPAY